MSLIRRLFFLIAILVLAPLASAQLIDSDASHAVILDHETGDVLWHKNGEALMIPASMTKMMTAHLVFDRVKSDELEFDQTFTVSENAWRKGGWASGGSTMGLAVGDQPTVAELLRGVIILSGNDACIVLAEGISGSEAAFAREMTALAREMGLDSATFENATGLNDENHRISAIDLARLARLTMLEHPEFYPLYAQPDYEWRGISQPNRNPLLGRMEGVDGLKTGHLEASGYGLTASGVQDGVRRIIVINGMDSEAERAQEAERLMRLAFSAFATRQIDPVRLDLPALDVWMGARSSVPVELQQAAQLTAHKRAFADAVAEIVYQGPLEAPILAGEEVARLIVMMEGEQRLDLPLVAAEDVPRIGFVGKVLEGLRLKIEGGEAA